MTQNAKMAQNDPKWPKTDFFHNFFLLKKRFRKLFRFQNVWVLVVVMMMMMICRAGPVIDVGGSDVVRFSDSLAFGASGNLTCDNGDENDDDEGVQQLQ